MDLTVPFFHSFGSIFWRTGKRRIYSRRLCSVDFLNSPWNLLHVVSPWRPAVPYANSAIYHLFFVPEILAGRVGNPSLIQMNLVDGSRRNSSKLIWLLTIVVRYSTLNCQMVAVPRSFLRFCVLSILFPSCSAVVLVWIIELYPVSRGRRPIYASS